MASSAPAFPDGSTALPMAPEPPEPFLQDATAPPESAALAGTEDEEGTFYGTAEPEAGSRQGKGLELRDEPDFFSSLARHEPDVGLEAHDEADEPDPALSGAVPAAPHRTQLGPSVEAVPALPRALPELRGAAVAVSWDASARPAPAPAQSTLELRPASPFRRQPRALAALRPRHRDQPDAGESPEPRPAAPDDEEEEEEEDEDEEYPQNEPKQPGGLGTEQPDRARRGVQRLEWISRSPSPALQDLPHAPDAAASSAPRRESAKTKPPESRRAEPDFAAAEWAPPEPDAAVGKQSWTVNAEDSVERLLPEPAPFGVEAPPYVCGVLLEEPAEAERREQDDDAGVFTCIECSIYFRRREHLLEHMLQHNRGAQRDADAAGRRRFCCGECGWAFGEPAALERHKRLHQESREKIIEEIQKLDEFPDEGREARLQCPKCVFGTNSSKIFVQHAKMHVKERKEQSSRSAGLFGDGAGHGLYKAEEPPAVPSGAAPGACVLCGFPAPNEHILKEHLRFAHSHFSWQPDAFRDAADQPGTSRDSYGAAVELFGKPERLFAPPCRDGSSLYDAAFGLGRAKSDGAAKKEHARKAAPHPQPTGFAGFPKPCSLLRKRAAARAPDGDAPRSRHPWAAGAEEEEEEEEEEEPGAAVAVPRAALELKRTFRAALSAVEVATEAQRRQLRGAVPVVLLQEVATHARAAKRPRGKPPKKKKKNLSAPLLEEPLPLDVLLLESPLEAPLELEELLGSEGGLRNEERRCPYCPDRFHNGIGLANHVRGHLNRVGVSYNVRHFISAEEVKAIEQRFSFQKKKKKVANFDPGTFSLMRCEFCGAGFDTAPGSPATPAPTCATSASPTGSSPCPQSTSSRSSWPAPPSTPPCCGRWAPGNTGSTGNGTGSTGNGTGSSTGSSTAISRISTGSSSGSLEIITRIISGSLEILTRIISGSLEILTTISTGSSTGINNGILEILTEILEIPHQDHQWDPGNPHQDHQWDPGNPHQDQQWDPGNPHRDPHRDPASPFAPGWAGEELMPPYRDVLAPEQDDLVAMEVSSPPPLGKKSSALEPPPPRLSSKVSPEPPGKAEPQDSKAPSLTTCEVCGACFETRKGLSSHARSHLRQLGVAESESSGAPIDLLYELVRHKTKPEPGSTGSTGLAKKSASPKEPGAPRPLLLLPKAEGGAVNKAIKSPPGFSKCLAPPASPGAVKKLPAALPGSPKGEEKGGKMGMSPLQTESGWGAEEDGPLNLTSGSEPCRDIRCEFCGEFFENRKGLSSHARSHLRQMGVTEWYVNGSPIDTLREILTRRRSGHPKALPKSLLGSLAPLEPRPPPELHLPGLPKKVPAPLSPPGAAPGAASPPPPTARKVFPGLQAPSLQKKLKQDQLRVEIKRELMAGGGGGGAGIHPGEAPVPPDPAWAAHEEMAPLNLSSRADPVRDIRCEFCGEFFENRKGLSSHARSHLRQMGVTEWSVNGSPIDTLREILRKKSKPCLIKKEPPLPPGLEAPPAEDEGLEAKGPPGLQPPGKALPPGLALAPLGGSRPAKPGSALALAPLGAKNAAAFLAPKRPLGEERLGGHGEAKHKAFELGFKAKALHDKASAEACCELCGLYFENRKALASHARAHLRQFGVTEWCVNGSPIETLREWIRHRPHKAGAYRSYIQGGRPFSKKFRNSPHPREPRGALAVPPGPFLPKGALGAEAALGECGKDGERAVGTPLGVVKVEEQRGNFSKFERRQARALEPPLAPGPGEFPRKLPEPRPAPRPVPALVPRPPHASLVKFVGNIYTLKCRFCEVEFQGPLSIQEEWVRHLQRHILDMNFSKADPCRSEAPPEPPALPEAP